MLIDSDVEINYFILFFPLQIQLSPTVLCSANTVKLITLRQTLLSETRSGLSRENWTYPHQDCVCNFRTSGTLKSHDITNYHAQKTVQSLWYHMTNSYIAVHFISSECYYEWAFPPADFGGSSFVVYRNLWTI